MDEQSIAEARNRLVTRSRRFSEAWDAFAREFDLQELAINPDEVFPRSLRSDDAGALLIYFDGDANTLHI